MEVTQEYPAPDATHEQVVEDRELFRRTLQDLHRRLDVKFRMPKVGGAEIDLHRLYCEVTALGGLDAVTHRKQWVLACEPFNFPSSFTNKSYVVKKLYIQSLHHYEQVYFYRREGAIVPPPVIAPAPSTSSPKRRRTCKAEPCVVENVVVVADGPSSNSASTSCVFKSLEAGTCFTGVIDSVLSHGFRITLHLPGQCLQGILYKQTPNDVPPAMAAGQPQGMPRATTTHTDDTAMSQEMDSMHQVQSTGQPLSMRPASAPPAPAPIPPRPPRSAYQFFQLGVNKQQLLQLHPRHTTLPAHELLPKLMAELWHQMTQEQHRPFFNMAQRDKARYDREWEDYARRVPNAVALAAAEPAEQLPELWKPPSPTVSMRTHAPQLLSLDDSPPPYGAGARAHHAHAYPAQLHADAFHAPPMQPSPPAPEPGPSPLYHRRMCLGIPVPPTQHTFAHVAKAPMHGMRPPPAAGPQFQPSTPRHLNSNGPDLDLLPPDMDPEDLDHLCHYQQDTKPFHFDMGGPMIGTPMGHHAQMDAFSLAMDMLVPSHASADGGGAGGSDLFAYGGQERGNAGHCSMYAK